MRRKRRQPARIKKIFITGGTGFFGKSMLMHLPELKRHKLVILSREDRESFANIEFIKGDIRDFKYPKGVFDYIIHGAATSSTIIPDDEMSSVILDGTTHVLKFARTTDIKNFLFISSGAVYGKQFVPVHEESDSVLPITVYGQSKLIAEQLCKNADIPYSIARCFAFVGEELPLHEHFAIGNFIGNCLENKPIHIKGDGTPIRSYMYTGDLSRWLWTILLKGNGIYNVGSDMLISISDLAKMVRKIARTKNVILISQPKTPGLPPCYAPLIRKAKDDLDLSLTIPLEEAIEKTIKWHTEQ